MSLMKPHVVWSLLTPSEQRGALVLLILMLVGTVNSRDIKLLSRAGFPKRFLCITGDDSLFRRAARCLASLGDADISVAAFSLWSN